MLFGFPTAVPILQVLLLLLLAALVHSEAPPLIEDSSVAIISLETDTRPGVGDHHQPSQFSVKRKSLPDDKDANAAMDGRAGLVNATWMDTQETTGTGRLLISTNEHPGATDRDYFYAMGLAEGYLTCRRVIQHMYNMIWSKPRRDPRAAEKHGDDAFWFNVWMQLSRLDGMMEGLVRRQEQAIQKKETGYESWAYMPVTFLALYELNSNSEIGEIESAVTTDPAARAEDPLRISRYPMAEETKCSVLIKLTDDDLIVSHNTWTTYTEMLRVYKSFSFPHVQHASIRSRDISMSSYPGYFSSTDDWLITHDTQLAITETTTESVSMRLLQEKVRPLSVTTVIRSVVATLMASSGRDWYNTFSRHNSGTYNNQWMIIDFNHFRKWNGSGRVGPMPEGTFWMVEQMPGLIVAKDMSDKLQEQGYWASYNRPYFKNIQDVGGYTAAAAKHGQWYQYDDCPRARLFREWQGQVNDTESMMRIMTTNHWRTDPLSENCPKNAIAGRYDLPYQPQSDSAYESCGPVKAYGAIDCKVTSSSLLEQDKVLMWTNYAGEKVPHWGMPDRWEFPWYSYSASRADGVVYEEGPPRATAVAPGVAASPEEPSVVLLGHCTTDSHGVWAFGGLIFDHGGKMVLVGRCNNSIMTVCPRTLEPLKVLCDFGYFGPVTSQTLTTSIGICTDGSGLTFFNSADAIYWLKSSGRSGVVPITRPSGVYPSSFKSPTKHRWGCLRYSQGYLFAIDEGVSSSGVGDTLYRIDTMSGECDEIVQTHWRVWSFDVYQSPRSGRIRLLYSCLYQDKGVYLNTFTAGLEASKAKVLPIRCVMECRMFAEGRLACLGGSYGRNIFIADLVSGSVLCGCDVGVWRGVLSIEVDDKNARRVYVARSWGSDVEGEKHLKRDLLQLKMDYL
ncbi:hypothetical protein FOL47_010028 [Perkinsus chesapeaki]|uniref:Phospholipase B domain containing n=1 Tax=Perkinsus chesapeaki TaxID=330153 RepID=A0A7J6L5A2_PERCH|nr:hypothetical protein FOL47_010028 [Perkinsus chesapeaki]